MTVDTDKLDKYRRNVGKVLVDGVEAYLEQLKRGMAWHYKAYQGGQSVIDRRVYDDAANIARVAKKGMWADAEPVPSWAFRHNK